MSVYRFTTRFAAWLLLSMLILAVTPHISVEAQDKKAAAPAADSTAEEEAPAEEATGGEAAAPAESEHKQTSQLMWIIHTSGWIGGVLLVISIYFVTVVTQLFLELREPLILPPGLLDECNALLA